MVEVDDAEFVFRATLQRIDVNFQVVLKETPEVLKNAAGQVGIMFFGEQLINTRETPITMAMRSRVCSRFLKKIEISATSPRCFRRKSKRRDTGERFRRAGLPWE